MNRPTITEYRVKQKNETTEPKILIGDSQRMRELSTPELEKLFELISSELDKRDLLEAN